MVKSGDGIPGDWGGGGGEGRGGRERGGGSEQSAVRVKDSVTQLTL